MARNDDNSDATAFWLVGLCLGAAGGVALAL